MLAPSPRTRYSISVRVSALYLVLFSSTTLLLAAATETLVSFQKDVAPILLEKCMGCHNPTKQKGKFQLHTFNALQTAGASRNPPVVPRQPSQSHLYQLLNSPDPETRMPYKEDPLPREKIEVLRRWIEQGARYDGTNADTPMMPEFQGNHPQPPDIYPQAHAVSALAISPDGQQVVAGGYHELLVFHAQTGALARRIKNVDQQTYGLAYSADGQLIAAASGFPGRSGEYKLVDTATGSTARTLARLSDSALAITFNSNGTKVAAGGADAVVRVFDVATGREDLHLEANTDWVMDVRFSPDSTKLIAASRDKTLRVLKSSDGELLVSYLEHESPVSAVACTPDGKRAVSVDAAGQLHLWDVESGNKIAEVRTAAPVLYRVHIIEERIFTAGADHKIHEYRLGDKPQFVLSYLGSRDHVFALAVSPGRGWIAGGSYDGRVHLWEIGQTHATRTFAAKP